MLNNLVQLMKEVAELAEKVSKLSAKAFVWAGALLLVVLAVSFGWNVVYAQIKDVEMRSCAPERSLLETIHSRTVVWLTCRQHSGDLCQRARACRIDHEFGAGIKFSGFNSAGDYAYDKVVDATRWCRQKLGDKKDGLQAALFRLFRTDSSDKILSVDWQATIDPKIGSIRYVDATPSKQAHEGIQSQDRRSFAGTCFAKGHGTIQVTVCVEHGGAYEIEKHVNVAVIGPRHGVTDCPRR